jgi:transposase
MKNILGWFETKITNACCEGVNNIFQMLKRCAKGFKKLINLRNILFIKCGTFNKYAPTQI